MIKTKTLLTMSVAALCFGGAAHAENWDMPMAYPANNYHTENAQIFVDDVRECTGGELDITIHAGGSLFKGNEIKRAVQVGEAQIGERLLSAHANENAVFGYDSVPFLATSFAASDKLRDAAKPTLNALLNDQNMTLLYSVPWPPQGLYFAKEVNTLADAEGLKFRAYNAATARVAELGGMVPTQIEAAELKQALATGVVQAFISSGSTGVDEKVWEDLTNFYDAKAWLPRNSIFVNSDAFDGLPDASKECLMSKAAEAEARGSAKAEELAGGFLATLAENGLTVSEPSEGLSADLAVIGATMTDEWLAQAGDAGAAIVDAYKN
ncbi:TRAP transporter substrate-binding protein [Meridianimarinicoccus aquatilis]|uniref:C4-dicarboxylate ABC transporter substrate-binding protein n=1 Tax=Meridianimarinicoccus aquatilis TaxID=2552766 RepID=A0A4R6B4C8_9RHOB|nr:TRAP transporter substrate-binding protein [Fluviibacterium aquatile]QIE42274.1 TRAP transporter substrate-binding protein [Rhodobacteraceae bacterium SC52]TDL91322.1 C4-dicarboxylate ABC transporter substrate-binding protein [Fluviibacterium aquatile]